MTVQQLPINQWHGYFDELSAHVRGLQVDIEVAGFDIGDQMQASHVRLEGITYDPADDKLEVAVEGYLHLLVSPQEIAIDRDGDRVRGIAATDPQGRTHEIRFRQPIARLKG